jgi:hypothetical protein
VYGVSDEDDDAGVCAEWLDDATALADCAVAVAGKAEAPD